MPLFITYEYKCDACGVEDKEKSCMPLPRSGHSFKDLMLLPDTRVNHQVIDGGLYCNSCAGILWQKIGQAIAAMKERAE